MSAEKKACALLILAHNEATVIEDTVWTAKSILMSQDALFVVADHCTDDTANKARNAGAEVVIRNETISTSKGHALSWFVREYSKRLDQFSYLIILDADSQLKTDFLDHVRENITEECEAMQCCVYPKFEQRSPISTLSALSELHDQYISDRIRSKLGWPVRMRGTGMILKPELLFHIDGQLNSNVEDIALSLILATKGIKVKRLDDAILFDPKPSTIISAANQRARWFRGQWEAMWQYRREIVHLFRSGLPGWSLFSSLFLKPKWLVLTTSLVLAILLSPWRWVAILFGLYFSTGVLYLFIGLCIIPERHLFFRTLIFIPLYIWMWLRSIILSLRASSWLKARE